MTLSTCIDVILESSPDDWNVIPCWGAGSGSSFKYQFEPLHEYVDGKAEWRIVVAAHGMVAAYTANLAVSLAWGLPANETFHEEWTDKFSDKSASSRYVDIFYNGGLVHREMYVSVDGGRSALPLPDASEGGYRVSSRFCRFINLVNTLNGGSGNRFESDLKQAGLQITDDTWPSFYKQA